MISQEALQSCAEGNSILVLATVVEKFVSAEGTRSEADALSVQIVKILNGTGKDR